MNTGESKGGKQKYNAVRVVVIVQWVFGVLWREIAFMLRGSASGRTEQ